MDCFLSLLFTFNYVFVTVKAILLQNQLIVNWKIYLRPTLLAEFILEDGKLFTDGIPSERMPSDMNSSLQVATDVNCKMQSSPKRSSNSSPICRNRSLFACFFNGSFSRWYSQERSIQDFSASKIKHQRCRGESRKGRPGHLNKAI